MDTSALAKRMKKYEAVSKNVLMRRTPVIIRVDGRAFHTFTKGFQKPFDEVLMSAIIETAVTNDWNVIETFKEYYEDFSYGELGKIEFDE